MKLLALFTTLLLFLIRPAFAEAEFQRGHVRLSPSPPQLF
jgi:hypothetical protein